MFKSITNQIITTLLILLVYIILYALKRHLFPSEIVFFESILFSLFLIILLFIFTYFFLESNLKRYIAESLLASFLLISLFNSLIPTILDRSVSITVLGTLKKSSYPISKIQIDNTFNEIYVIQEDAVGIRLKEQLASGNIRIDESGNYILTKKGIFVTDVLFYTSKFFNVNTAFIDQHL